MRARSSSSARCSRTGAAAVSADPRCLPRIVLPSCADARGAPEVFMLERVSQLAGLSLPSAKTILITPTLSVVLPQRASSAETAHFALGGFGTGQRHPGQ